MTLTSRTSLSQRLYPDTGARRSLGMCRVVLLLQPLIAALLVFLLPRLAAATIDVGPTASLLGMGGKELEYAIVVEAYEGCDSDGCQIYALDTRQAGFKPLYRKKLSSLRDELRGLHCIGLEQSACHARVDPLEVKRRGTMTSAELDLSRYLERLSPFERAQLALTSSPLGLPGWSLPQQTPGSGASNVSGRVHFIGEGHKLELQVRKLWDVASVRAYDGDNGCNPQHMPACKKVTRYVNGLPLSTWTCPQEKILNQEGDPMDCGGRALMVQLEAKLDGGKLVEGSKALLEPFRLVSNWRGMVTSRGVAVQGLSLRVEVFRVPFGLLVVGGLTDGAMNGTWFPAVMSIPFEPKAVFTAVQARDFVSKGRPPTVFPFELGDSRVVYGGTHELLSTSRFFDLVRQVAPAFSFTRKGKELRFSYQLLQLGGQPLYDAEDWSTSYFRDQVGRQGMRGGYGLRFEPLSLVGDVVSWALEKEHYQTSAFWNSTDLSTGKAPALLDLFDEASLVTALLDNGCIQEGIQASSVGALSSFAQLVLSYQQPQGTDCPASLDRFTPAFLGFDAQEDLTHVQLAYGRSAHQNNSGPYQMGFYIQPSPDFREDLKRAVAGDGFFLGELQERGFF